jgi:hypothetical protein
MRQPREEVLSLAVPVEHENWTLGKPKSRRTSAPLFDFRVSWDCFPETSSGLKDFHQRFRWLLLPLPHYPSARRLIRSHATLPWFASGLLIGCGTIGRNIGRHSVKQYYCFIASLPKLKFSYLGSIDGSLFGEITAKHGFEGNWLFPNGELSHHYPVP